LKYSIEDKRELNSEELNFLVYSCKKEEYDIIE